MIMSVIPHPQRSKVLPLLLAVILSESPPRPRAERD